MWSDYKFFLAFENSLCEDYITEKVWDYLGKAVLIVLGAVNYTHYLPPHSFIDIRDFLSARALAEYLLYLDQNPEKYAEYFYWMYEYRAFTDSDPLISWACGVCEYLHTHTISTAELASPRVSLQDLTNVTHSCMDPDLFYKDIIYD